MDLPAKKCSTTKYVCSNLAKHLSLTVEGTVVCLTQSDLFPDAPFVPCAALQGPDPFPRG